ncbi:hypothetical protein L9F63_001947, partial [Diploptera punctata]
MEKLTVVLVLFAVSPFTATDGAKILGLFTIPSISHQIVYRALMKELHSRGHEIVVLTTDPIRDPKLENYSEIDLSSSYEMWKPKIAALVERRLKGGTTFSMFLEFVEVGLDLCEIELNLPKVKEILENSGSNFDLIIMETILSPCFFVFPYKLNAPYIGITSVPPTTSTQSSVGNPANPAYSPDFILGYTDHLTFTQRFHSTLYSIALRLLDYYWIFPAHDAMVRRIFNDTSMPYIGELANNVSVLLANYHYSFYYPRPNVPNMIEIAGLHLATPGSLPKDLQKFMDTSPEGVIYFSLGTNVRSDKMLVDRIQMFLGVFSELPQFHVLWKWDGEEMHGHSNNVKISKWFPQQDVLAHPKVKAFMYQGGLQSTEEAIRSQVPVVGIPFIADQEINIRKLVNAGAGIKIGFNEINKENVLKTLNEVIYNQSYKSNMIKLSIITKDLPDTAMERAVWWTEYVIRHKGAPHLRCATVDLTWYQYLLLDVTSFITITFIMIVWLSYCFMKLSIPKLKYVIKR